MKRHHIITLILAIFFVTMSIHGVNAQSISGDEVCGGLGGKACTLSDAGKIINRALSGFIIPIGTVALILFIGMRFLFAYKAYVEGNANAFKEATSKVGNAILGFIILIALFGGFLFVLLKFAGVRSDGEFNPLKLLQLISDSFFPHAYAIEGKLLPNPLDVTNLYDFLLNVARLVIRWFVYPAVIVMWVWSGVSYVIAQGNPEKLGRSHRWLMWAAICTIIIFVAEGFLFALRGTVQQILPGTKTSQQIIVSPVNERISYSR